MQPLTMAAQVRCSHKGTVTIKTSVPWCTIGGNAVLKQTDTIGCSIGGCPNMGPTIKPCTTTTTETAGHSSFITVGGAPLVLKSLQGITDGTPPGTVVYKPDSSGQSFVEVSG